MLRWSLVKKQQRKAESARDLLREVLNAVDEWAGLNQGINGRPKVIPDDLRERAEAVIGASKEKRS